MNDLIKEAIELQEELKKRNHYYQKAIFDESQARQTLDVAKQDLADAEAMELAARDVNGYMDGNGKPLAASSKAYQTAREAFLVGVRLAGLDGHVQSAQDATEAYREAVTNVAVTKAALDAVKVQAKLQGEILRYVGSAEQAELGAQVGAITEAVKGMQVGQDEMAQVVNHAHERITEASARGKLASDALEAAGKALASFTTMGDSEFVNHGPETLGPTSAS